MQIKSGAELLALTVAGVALFLVYAFIIGTGVDLVGGYLAEGCALEGSGALRASKDGPVLCAEFWFNRYQGLVGGVLALGGAFLAFSAVRQQIAQTERHADDRRQRDSNAARAVVPHALNGLNSYAHGCVRALRNCRPDGEAHLALAPFNPPEFPDEIIPVLQDAVRYSDPDIAAQFADLIAQTQVQLARIEGAAERCNREGGSALTVTELQDRMFDALDLYVRTGRLYEYGRHFLNRGLVTSGDLRGSLRVLDLELEEWPMIDRRIRARAEVEAARGDT